jgi:hypothetical protein
MGVRTDVATTDLYSIMVDGGRCNTARILSLLHASVDVSAVSGTLT